MGNPWDPDPEQYVPKAKKPVRQRRISNANGSAAASSSKILPEIELPESDDDDSWLDRDSSTSAATPTAALLAPSATVMAYYH